MSSSELDTLGATLKADLFAFLKSDILPAIDAAAKSAVASINPIVGVVAAPVIDEIDAYIAGLLGAAVPTVTAPVDVPSQITALQKHVAALTVASGHATTQAMVTAKVATAGLPELSLAPKVSSEA
jgi:hypothetical protein